jgi:hypothetical protein
MDVARLLAWVAYSSLYILDIILLLLSTGLAKSLLLNFIIYFLTTNNNENFILTGSIQQ